MAIERITVQPKGINPATGKGYPELVDEFEVLFEQVIDGRTILTGNRYVDGKLVSPYASIAADEIVSRR